MISTNDSRLILVEGLPGTGKTTLATSLAADLRAAGEEVELYLEGDLHPCDLQWISRMSHSEYASAVEHLRQHWLRSRRTEPWERILDRLAQQSTVEEGMVLTAYTRLDFADTELWAGLDPFRESEVHDGRVSFSEYRDIYQNRWKRFAEQQRVSSTIFIFECAFLQCHVTELLGHHRAPDVDILEFLMDMIGPTLHIKPTIHYVRSDDYPSRIRESAQTRGDWLADLITWVETSAYGKAHGLSGFDGAMIFFQHRLRIEETAMNALGLPVEIIKR